MWFTLHLAIMNDEEGIIFSFNKKFELVFFSLPFFKCSLTKICYSSIVQNLLENVSPPTTKNIF